jgi:NADH-quinone oxidoreductase subunit M
MLLIFFFPLITIFILWNIKKIIYIDLINLISSAIILGFSIFCFSIFDENNFYYFFKDFFFFNLWNLIYFNFGIDMIALYFILLINLLIFLCFLYNINNLFFGIKEFSICLHFIQIFLNFLFLTLDLLWFFIFFECILIPMFFIIGIWGSRIRKIHAIYMFYLYTLIGSIFMFFAILLLFVYTNTFDLILLKYLNLNILIPNNLQNLIWFLLFISFSLKVPVIPLHIWLPEAHVEAPTTGSVLLAGILLKLGFYGILRILIPILAESCFYYNTFIFFVSSFSIIMCSFIILGQIDLKKIIAYSSIIHMNFALIGLFTMTFESFLGSIFLILNHGIISPGLFFCIGILYDRTHTRLITYYGSLNLTMPLFTVFLLIIALANFGFPGTSSFIGELLLLLGSLPLSNLGIMFLNFTMFISLCYIMWFVNKILYGILKKDVLFFDVSKKEFCVLLPIILFIIFIGFFPIIFFNNLEINLKYLFNFIYY